MIHFCKNPSWIDFRLFCENKLDEIPQSLFEEIKTGLALFQSQDPIVSVVIPALNEETSILRTLHSLSRNKTFYPTEIIVVNNNSSDRTQEVLDKLNVKSYTQVKPGWGPARQLGQQKAKGKFILMADADCFYPSEWIEKMTNELLKEGVTCVYGKYCFLGTADRPRWKLFLYESLRDIIVEFRHMKRPWLNAVGMSMGYVRELGLRKGFIDRNIRGEDGRMCFELMQFGRIVHMRAKAVTVWTFPRTLQKDGNLMHSIFNRVLIEFSRFKSYFLKLPVHDTHSSPNFTPAFLKYFKRYKEPKKEKEPGLK
jgi:glycosyltransferase involved in cell wall biosynthesis